MDTTITPQYLIRIYDDLQREQLNLINKIKNSNNNDVSGKQDAELTKQISLLTQIMMGCIKLKKMKERPVL